MKIAILNDTHAGVRNSSDIMMDYQELFYRDVFFPYLKEHGITRILHLGDYYENRSTINFKALNHNRRIFLDVLRREGIKMDIIPGNHDVYYKNTNSLNALKELLGHYMNEVNIIEEPTVMDYGVALIPWINSENEEGIYDFLRTCKARTVGAHLELAGFEMQKGVESKHGTDASVFKRFEMVLSGHYHTKSSKDNIHYLGSQMEFFWSDCDDKKYFHVLDTDISELTPVHNPHTLFTKLYYSEENPPTDLSVFDHKFIKVIVVDRKDPKLFDDFLDRLNKRPVYEVKVAEDMTVYEGEQVDDDEVTVDNTEDLLYSYVEAIDTELDKGRIKGIVRELMKEAQTMELL